MCAVAQQASVAHSMMMVSQVLGRILSLGWACFKQRHCNGHRGRRHRRGGVVELVLVVACV